MSVTAKLSINGKEFSKVAVLNPGFMFGRTLLAIVTPEGMAPSICVVEESSIPYATEIVLDNVRNAVSSRTPIKVSILSGSRGTVIPEPFPCVYVDDDGVEWKPSEYWFNHPAPPKVLPDTKFRGTVRPAGQRIIELQNARGKKR